MTHKQKADATKASALAQAVREYRDAKNYGALEFVALLAALADYEAAQKEPALDYDSLDAWFSEQTAKGYNLTAIKGDNIGWRCNETGEAKYFTKPEPQSVDAQEPESSHQQKLIGAYQLAKDFRAAWDAKDEDTFWEKFDEACLSLTAFEQAQPTEQPGEADAFKAFHKRLCERFGYGHDEQDWRRDLASLEEHIAKLKSQPGEARADWIRAIEAADKLALEIEDQFKNIESGVGASILSLRWKLNAYDKARRHCPNAAGDARADWMRAFNPENGQAIAEMINAFLKWPIPESVASDPCVTRQSKGRTGTNLLSLPETMQMIQEVVCPIIAAHAPKLSAPNEVSAKELIERMETSVPNWYSNHSWALHDAIDEIKREKRATREARP